MSLKILVLINKVNHLYTMVNRVVSTKISEEEHGRIVEMCNDIGITVSTMVKQAIRERVKKEEKERKRLESQMKKISHKTSQTESDIMQSSVSQIQTRRENKTDDKYLYF